jgi:DNA polymerase-3 subunit gamma/tau
MQAMLPTIRSRCQRFTFQRPGLPEISTVLHRIATAETIQIDDAAVQQIARAASGSFRDGVTILDQLSTAHSGAITAEDVRALLGSTDENTLFALLDLVAAGDGAGALRFLDELADGGTDLASFTTGLLGHLRALFLTQQLGATPADLGLSDDERERLTTQAEALTPQAVVRLIDLLREVVGEVKEGGDPRLPLELALVKVCRPQTELALEAIDQRLARLEAGAPASAPAPAAAQVPTPAPAALAQAPAPVQSPPADDPPPPAPSAPAAAAPPTFEQLDQRWPEAILPEIGRRSTPLHALVASSKPVSLNDAEAVIGLPPSAAFALSTVETPANLRLITEVVGQALGAERRVRFVVIGEPDGEVAEQAVAAPEDPVSEHELVSRIAQEFDAHEV